MIDICIKELYELPFDKLGKYLEEKITDQLNLLPSVPITGVLIDNRLGVLVKKGQVFDQSIKNIICGWSPGALTIRISFEGPTGKFGELSFDFECNIDDKFYPTITKLIYVDEVDRRFYYQSFSLPKMPRRIFDIGSCSMEALMEAGINNLGKLTRYDEFRTQS